MLFRFPSGKALLKKFKPKEAYFNEFIYGFELLQQIICQ